MRQLLILLIATQLGAAQVTVDELTGKTRNSTGSIQLETEKAFEKMRQAALKEGISITIVSGYRSYERQRQIWNRKYDTYRAQGLTPLEAFDKVVQYSTVPGTSRHHWGTDIDIIDGAITTTGDVLVPEKFYGTGAYNKMKNWLDMNASGYGFEMAYPKDDNRPGFNHEPWHWSYAPLSRKRYNDYLQQIQLVPFLRSQQISGMKEIPDERLLRYLEEHIKGINPSLK